MPTPLHVLILEDSPSDVELMLHELRRAGFEPHWQHVATEQDFLAQLAPPPDIILADYTLPQFDALRALRCAQERVPDVPVIVVTGTLSDEAAVVCLKQGAADYLLKDRLGRLGEAVRHALAERDLRVQHRQAHDALRASEERFRALSEHASDLVGILDADGTYRYASAAHRRILGYASAEVQGRNVFELMHPDDVPHTQAAFAALLQSPGAMETAEFRMRHADGSWRTLEGIGTNRLHDPAVRGIIANARDITERKRAEAERAFLLAREQATRQVAEARAELAAIVKASDDAIIGKTLDGTITSWNPAAARLYGYSAAEAIGQSMSLLFPPDHHDELPELLGRVARGDSITQFETERLCKDGTRLAVSVSIAPVRAASGTVVGAAAVARDITERKRAEAALEESNRELARSNAELKQFASIASHDLRSPLNTIGGYARLVAMRYMGKLDADADEFLAPRPSASSCPSSASIRARSIPAQALAWRSAKRSWSGTAGASGWNQSPAEARGSCSPCRPVPLLLQERTHRQRVTHALRSLARGAPDYRRQW